MGRMLKIISLAIVTSTLLLTLTLFGLNTIWTPLRSKLESTVQQDSIHHRLQQAESNWVKANKRIEEALGRGQGGVVWDFFYPSFDCPFTKERIGRVGDGGKWVCGFETLLTKPKCVVYSFGVQDETSFEEEILQRTEKCIVRMFDPTIGSSAPHIVFKYSYRAFFYPIGISGNYSMTENMKTLKIIMDENGDEFLDVLKIDVEGAEWKSLQQILKDFPHELPFGQLQTEFHLDIIPRYEWFKVISELWKQLQNVGLRAFNTEPNLQEKNIYQFREFSFINVRMEPFKLLLK